MFVAVRQWIAGVGNMAQDEVDRNPGHVFEGYDPVVAQPPRQRQQFHCRRSIADRDECGLHINWSREQFQTGSRNDAKSTFSSDEQVFQIIAGIVLAQSGQAVPDPAIRQNGFQSEAQIAGRAVAQDCRSRRHWWTDYLRSGPSPHRRG